MRTVFIDFHLKNGRLVPMEFAAITLDKFPGKISFTYLWEIYFASGNVNNINFPVNILCRNLLSLINRELHRGAQLVILLRELVVYIVKYINYIYFSQRTIP